MHNTNEW